MHSDSKVRGFTVDAGVNENICIQVDTQKAFSINHRHNVWVHVLRFASMRGQNTLDSLKVVTHLPKESDAF